MRPLKILHCANFSESKNAAVYYAIDRKLSNGFTRNNHFVYNFSYRDLARCSNIFNSKKFGIKKINQDLIKTVDNLQPDLLLLGHSELISEDSLKKIKEITPNIKIAMWWVDPFDKSSHIHKRMDYLDSFFATTGTSKLKELFGELDKLHFFPNVCDNSIENQKSFEKEDYSFDILYVGRSDDRRKDFIENLKKLKSVKVGIYGDNKENIVYGHKYYDLISSTKAGLNFSRYNDIELYSSDRIIQLTSNGIFTFTPRVPGFTKLFSENEVVYFDNFDDFKDKLYYYLKDDRARKKIAKNGYEKAHRSYNSTRIAKYMLETIYKQNFSEKYEWISQ